ncbi:hypothetical protein F4809DRAFT_661034 [Biscogniauxia mediterranea]|nr:hypothetical protein F4809DRAFT_661034 [Biscogniauxia mediterranea]
MRCENLNVMAARLPGGRGRAARGPARAGPALPRPRRPPLHALQRHGGSRRLGGRYGRYSVDGRVVVMDCAAYHWFEADSAFDRTEAAKRQRTLRRWNRGVDATDDVIFDELPRRRPRRGQRHRRARLRLHRPQVRGVLHRPLYMIVGRRSGNGQWGALLLIDEADVFLERRSLRDMQRNAMVTVFLRVLEYYRGIFFLTTNRVSTFENCKTQRRQD